MQSLLSYAQQINPEMHAPFYLTWPTAIQGYAGRCFHSDNNPKQGFIPSYGVSKAHRIITYLHIFILGVWISESTTPSLSHSRVYGIRTEGKSCPQKQGCRPTQCVGVGAAQGAATATENTHSRRQHSSQSVVPQPSNDQHLLHEATHW